MFGMSACIVRYMFPLLPPRIGNPCSVILNTVPGCVALGIDMLSFLPSSVVISFLVPI